MNQIKNWELKDVIMEKKKEKVKEEEEKMKKDWHAEWSWPQHRNNRGKSQWKQRQVNRNDPVWSTEWTWLLKMGRASKTCGSIKMSNLMLGEESEPLSSQLLHAKLLYLSTYHRSWPWENQKVPSRSEDANISPLAPMSSNSKFSRSSIHKE